MKKVVKNILGVSCSVSVVLGFIACSNMSVKAPESLESGMEEPLKEGSYLTRSGDTLKVGQNQKYKSIKKALEKANNDDVIEVYEGEYSELLNITKSVSIVAKGKVVLNAENIEVSGDTDIINIKASNVSLDGLELYGLITDEDGKHPCGIRVEDGSRNVYILNCKIHDIGYSYPEEGKNEDADYNGHGIWVGSQRTEGIGIEGVHIYNCELYNLSIGNSEALVLNGNVSEFEICNNKIHDCDNIGIDIIGYEEGNFFESNRARNGVIKGNIIKNISSKNNYTYEDCCAGGIYVDGGCSVEISSNLVIDCDIGIELASEHEGYSTEGITVKNNIIYNSGENSWAGISIGGSDDDNGEAKACVIKNNTVYCNGSEEGGAAFVVQKANDRRNIIEDNVFIVNGNGDPVEYSDDLEDFDNKSGNVIQNNCEFDLTDGKILSIKLDEDKGTLIIEPAALIEDGKGAGKEILKF